MRGYPLSLRRYHVEIQLIVSNENGKIFYSAPELRIGPTVSGRTVYSRGRIGKCGKSFGAASSQGKTTLHSDTLFLQKINDHCFIVSEHAKVLKLKGSVPCCTSRLTSRILIECDLT